MSATAPVPVITPHSPTPHIEPPRPASGLPWKWIALGILLVIGAWVAYRATRKTEKSETAAIAAIRTAKIAVGTLERTVRVGGQTSAREFVNVTAPIMRGPEGNRDMVLIELVPSGSMVKKGQKIGQIDAQSVQDHIDDLNDTIHAAEADVSKRRAEQQIEWEQLQQTLRASKATYDKAKLDAGAGEVRTDIERQLLQLSLDEAEASYKQQLADTTSKRASHQAELKILEITRERHTRHRNRHLLDLKRFTIYADMDGLAVMSPIFRGGEMGQMQQGDRVFPGQGFMKIVNPRSMQLEGTINQSETSDFRVGQTARLSFDAFPGMEMKGKIYSLGALAVSGWRLNYYIRTLPVRVQIQGSDPKLIPDLSASADVVVGREENKILVPLGAVSEENGNAVVYVKKGEGFERRDVQLGLKNDLEAVVVSGLRAGDEVRLNQ
jgi:HlyD family secretion protein